MSVELAKDKNNGIINTVEIGIKNTIKVGGQTTFPFLFEEGAMPNPPAIALEVLDCDPGDGQEHLRSVFGARIKDPVEWAKACVNEFGIKLLSVRLQSIHPDWGGGSADKAIATLQKMRGAVSVPFIIVGSSDDERDNEVLPKVSQALKGENCLFGVATQANYKTLAATCLADGHSIIAESPIDINIAKQVNILISDMGFDPKKIVMHPTTTSLGYGMEYVYSIMERSRLAAYIGDKMLSMPFILFVGQEAWKTKEAHEYSEAQGVNWEVSTAVSMLQSGGDIIVMQHPGAAKTVERYIERAMKQ